VPGFVVSTGRVVQSVLLAVAMAARFRNAPLESGLSGSPLSRSRGLTTSEIGNMKIIVSLVALCLVTAVASGQNPPMQDPVVNEKTVKVSDHVWAIMGWPNIGIVVGENATLVVDTGLGQRNGATVAKVAKGLAPKNKLYLTTTHFHPEHAGGACGFPAGTVLIRPQVQQGEMDKHGEEMIHLFASRNDRWRELLIDVKLPPPDQTFEKDLKLDLGGGVTARLLWFGGAHTKGDELTFVEPDKTLISGDVVQNKVVPRIAGDGGTPSSWIAVLDEVEKLGAARVLPTHSPVGDGSLVAKEKAFIVDLRTRALELKKDGVTAEQAGQSLTSDFKAKYPDWPITNVADFVKSIYAE
jgi:glyoxylase-like metal-dependent hydrolase (beta-lactamase superfamily II)